MSVSAFAGTWTCDTGLEDKVIYHMVVQGDENGVLVSPAQIQIAGMPGGGLELMADTAAADELSRSIIGYRDPRSKTLFRIMRQEVSPHVYVAHSLLVNFGVKKELDGTCSYTP